MNILVTLFWAGLWIGVLWVAVAMGQYWGKVGWRQRAEKRAFDAMVEQYQRDRLME
jgi:hypothetical protein